MNEYMQGLLKNGQESFSKIYKLFFRRYMPKPRADCEAPCFDQLKATHHRASPKQQALLDVLLQLIKTWPLTIGPWMGLEPN